MKGKPVTFVQFPSADIYSPPFHVKAALDGYEVIRAEKDGSNTFISLHPNFDSADMEMKRLNREWKSNA